jgi:hypothetical protein
MFVCFLPVPLDYEKCYYVRVSATNDSDDSQIYGNTVILWQFVWHILFIYYKYCKNDVHDHLK